MQGPYQLLGALLPSQTTTSLAEHGAGKNGINVSDQDNALSQAQADNGSFFS